MKQWFDGIYLLGQYNRLRTGCWLLVHGREAAVLEMPPHDEDELSPANHVAAALVRLGVSVKYLLCTHAHGDHFSPATLKELRNLCPGASIHLHAGFQKHVKDRRAVHWFDQVQELSLGGEPLYLVHAPKHSVTDTMVIFRGAICTGDWELRTIRSVHDSWSGITKDRKLASIAQMIAFVGGHDYRIHRVFSVHANDRREEVDFVALMEDTRVDRKFW